MEIEPQQFPMMPFMPTLTTTHVTHTRIIEDDGTPKTLVQIFFSTPVGVFSVYWDPDKAEDFADNVRLHARQAKSGLLIAGNGDVPPWKPNPQQN